jgi:DTW domain-containing protein YfiP
MTKTAAPHIADLKVIVLGNNYQWGKGETIEEARSNAGKPTYYVAYVVHPDSTVNGMGQIAFPNPLEANRPKLVMRKAPKGKR